MEEFLREEPIINYLLSGFIGAGIILGILLSEEIAKVLKLKPRVKLARRLYWFSWTLLIPCLYLSFLVVEGAVLKTLCVVPYATLMIISLMLWRDDDGEDDDDQEPPTDPDWDRFEKDFYRYAREKIPA